MHNIGEKKSSIIFNNIINDIKIGKIKSGDVLPSEAELSTINKVGRGSVREAMNALEMMGIVRRQAGNRTIIENLSIDSIFNPAGLHFEVGYENLIQVLEFREVFEEIVLKILIKKISEEDTKNLREILNLNKLYYDNGNIKKFSEYDYLFHRSLAYATHNIVIQNIHDLIFPFLKYIIESTRFEENLYLTLNDHFEIFNCIETKNYRKAKKFIGMHIKHVKVFLKTSYLKDKK